MMKRFLYVGLAALGLTVAAQEAKANCMFEMHCSRHISFVHTQKNHHFTWTSHATPMPCMGGSGCSSSGPAPWNGYVPPPAYPVAPAPVAVAPAPVAAPAPAAKAPAFSAPAPKQTPSVQQTGYNYYGQTASPNYNYNYNYNNNNNYNYGSSYLYYGNTSGSSRGPSYWYDD